MSGLRLWTEPYELRLRETLRISRGGADRSENVLVTIEADGQVGYGEASPDLFFGETQSTVLHCLRLFEAELGDDPFALDRILDRVDACIGGHYAAKAAVDIALHDLLGKLLGRPLYQVLGLDPTRTAELGYTIGIDSVDRMVAHAVEAATKYRVLKVKLGTTYDDDIVREVCQAVRVPIRVDVNGGWSAQHTLRMLDRTLVPLGIALLEQPVAANDLAGLKLVHDHSPIPVIVDESVTDLKSIPRLVDRCAGIDIKLMKCGGIRTARQMIAVARSFGLSVMMGCATESSLAITAGALLTPLADYADLDLHLILTNDPFRGATLSDGRFVLPSGPGLGVSRPSTAVTTSMSAASLDSAFETTRTDSVARVRR
jgi:L-alanine-DL-glutamate epimerase-like enolase superfamily enzyme